MSSPVRDHYFPVWLAAILMVSCAPSQNAHPTAPPNASQNTAAQDATTPYHKPVRMNGRGKIGTLAMDEVFALQQTDKTMIFDARPGFLFMVGHIPGAINLTKSNCDRQIANLEPRIKAALADGKTLIVYCSSVTCPDARSVAIHLSGFGYPVAIFSGGWAAWRAADLPTE